MKISLKLLLFFCIINFIFSLPFCTNTNEAPEQFEIDESKIINPIKYSGSEYQSINIGNQIFLNKDTSNFISQGTTTIYDDSNFCPDDFKIPTQTDYESLIKYLGSNAYSTFTDKDGFNMESGKYYLTNTIPKDITQDTQFNKMFMYLDGNSIKFISRIYYESSNSVRCMLDKDKIKLVLPFEDRDLNPNEKITINTNRNKYMNGFLWKINSAIFKTESIEYTFVKSGGHQIEFWGKYINGEETYLCDYIYVNKAEISSSQDFEDTKIQKIQTDFISSYDGQLHFAHSNFPVAPRNNGGYYIAFTDNSKYLHVLLYDKEDNLIKDFNTEEKAFPHDITETDYGFAIYMNEADSQYHSYLNLYNKNFELLNSVQIMNNSPNDDKKIDSNLEKQIMKYDSSDSPVYGMRFMFRPDNGKLIYSRGRIFLIFCHYNHFLVDGDHTGDTVVTFNDLLLDPDFGITWGASHSLIQSATFDLNYFWTAALSDAYPEGIKVEYTSKREFTNEYDPINKKYNSRKTGFDENLAGYIKGYHTGPADGKLGGILYFEKYSLYCLVYAKTPNYSENAEKNEKTIIFVTTWKLENGIITNNETHEIKIFESGNVMQLRAGKYGDDKIIIIYAETSTQGNNGYGNIAKGTIPKTFVIKVSDFTFERNDVVYDILLMNSNEDLRTFRDGVLIWGAADKDGKLVINKIGTPRLDDSNEDINDIITKEDVDNIKEKMKQKEQTTPAEETSNGFILTCGSIKLIMIAFTLILF